MSTARFVEYLMRHVIEDTGCVRNKCGGDVVA